MYNNNKKALFILWHFRAFVWIGFYPNSKPGGLCYLFEIASKIALKKQFPKNCMKLKNNWWDSVKSRLIWSRLRHLIVWIRPITNLTG